MVRKKFDKTYVVSKQGTTYVSRYCLVIFQNRVQPMSRVFVWLYLHILIGLPFIIIFSKHIP